MECHIKTTFDEQLVKSILFNEDIWSCVSDGYAQKETYVLDFEKNVFLAVQASDRTVGLYIVHPFNSTTLQVHANILPSFREKYAKKSAIQALKYIDKNFDERFKKLVALIPERYANVYRFTKSMGFSDEGCLTDAYFKDDQMDNIHILGLKRPDIQGLTNGLY